jgi:hypothetical protein
MNLKKWVAVVAIVQGVITSIAIVAAGLWALFTFVVTQSPLAVVRTELLKEHCTASGTLDINIIDNRKSYPQERISPPPQIIIGQVEMKNVGTRRVLVKVPNNPIRISKISFEPSGEIKQRDIVYDQDIQFFRAPSSIGLINKRAMSADSPDGDISILPGRTARQPFMAKVDSDGWYMVDFYGGPRDIDSDDPYCRKYSDNPNQPIPFHWEATAIFYVN